MKLLLVYQDVTLASSRIRIVQMAPWLERLGARCQAIQWPSTLRGRVQLARALSASTLCVVQKKLPNWLDAAWLARTSTPLVFDFDDAIPFRQVPRRGSSLSRTRARRFRGMLRISRGVIAGNRYLAGLCASFAGRLLVAPSPVPTDVPRQAGATSDTPVLGWIGGGGNLGSLASLHGALRQLARRRAFVLRVVSDRPLELAGVSVQNVRWTLEGQEREIARFDVGLMPVEAETPWTLGKCAYKLLQYMAAGVAGVASPIGMNAEVVEPGVNGELARDERDWLELLDRLLAEPERRVELGRAGRRTVEEHYSYEVLSRRWIGFLNELGT